MLDNITASQRILAHLHEGRLIQGTWHRERDGREFACLLGAIAPNIEDSSKCPASVMPAWLARLVVPMFDGQNMAAAMTWAGRFGAQMGRWHALDSAAWERVRAAFCAACVADAQRSADSAADDANAGDAARWVARAARAARAAADAAEAAWAAVVTAADCAWAAADAAGEARDAADNAARQACWTRMATALCDAIDAELEAVK
jgi:hypothetical protein